MITVFYDGKCGVCAREIGHYRKVAPEGLFIWQDITEAAGGLQQEGISLTEGLKYLHAKDAAGTMHVGVDAFLLIWRQLTRWRWLARVVALPGIRQMANRAYRTWAKRRFRRLPHCRLAATQEERL